MYILWEPQEHVKGEMVADKALVVDKRVNGGAVLGDGNIVQSKSVIGVCAEAFGCIPWRMRV